MFRLKVKENEKVLLYKDEKLIDVLGVGAHKMFHLFRNYRVERYDTKDHGIDGEKARTLHRLYPELVEKYFTIVDLADQERAYICIDGNFTEMLSLGELKLYWKELGVTVEKVNVKADHKVAKGHMEYIDMYGATPRGIKKHIVAPHEEAYFYLDEVFVEILGAGKHYFYTDLNDIVLQTVDKRVKELEITGQELLSADKVTLRCNLTMHYRVTDGMTYLTAVDDPYAYLYKQLQFAVRRHLGAMEIDALLSMQHTLSNDVLAELTKVCESVGIKVEAVHIKDIILPGEMREIFNQVIEATKRAEAHNIARREETAAMRSLLNTAKLMKDNPALARLKELEALENVVQKVGTLNVYGGLEHVMNGMIDLTGNKA